MVLSATIHHITNIPLEHIVRNPDNPRSEVVEDDQLRELASSITAVGLLEPIIVTAGKERNRFVLIAGERRTAAARLAGLKQLPAIVRSDLVGADATEAMLIENLQRVDLSPIEEARGYQQLVALGWTQEKIAGRTGRSQGLVSKRLKLLQLPEEVLGFVDEGKCTIADALELADVVDKPTVLKGALVEAKRYAGKGNGLGNVQRAVADQLRLEQREQENAEHADRLHAKGVSIVAGEPPAKGWDRLYGLGYELDKFKIPKPHTKDCTVAHLSAYGSWEYYCKAPKSHPKPVDPNAERQRAENRARKLLRETAATRHSFIIESILKPMPFTRSALVDFLTMAVVSGAGSWESLKLAREWLSLDPTVSLERAAATSTEAGRERIAVAVALATVEGTISSTYYSWGAAEVRHFALLERHGYGLTEIEVQKLDETKARLASDGTQTSIDAAACSLCGCTDGEACEVSGGGGPCAWVEGGHDGKPLCTACLPLMTVETADAEAVPA